MPRRRPPGDGHVNSIILLAAAIIFLPWLVDAQQQQRPGVQQRESPHEGNNVEATKIPPQIAIPGSYGRRKNTVKDAHGIQETINKNDASALVTTLAPAENAVEAPPARLPSSRSAGLTSSHTARSLEDWEVEDFVLLATVDGKLHARGRKTGQEKWELSAEIPMVKTEYHRRNRSNFESDHNPMPIDEYLWIVEPSRDGNLFIYRPSGASRGLVDTGLTIKKLVDEMSPYYDPDNDVIYNGRKQTTMMTVDAHTGNVIDYYSNQGVVRNENCKASNGNFDSAECKDATLTIGRLEYEVTIHGKQDSRHIATLNFSEWIPNTHDQDLQRQHHKSMDSKYIYTGHDGGVIGFDLDSSDQDGPGKKFKHKLASPVARVFDVARPWGTDRDHPDLILLPQPPPPNNDDAAMQSLRASSIFLNHTEDGSWFAMSGSRYPLAVDSIRKAQCTQQGWLQHHPQWDVTDSVRLSEALVGLHSLETVYTKNQPLAIAGPPNQKSSDLIRPVENAVDFVEEPNLLQQGTEQLIDYVYGFFRNPLLYLFLAGFVFYNHQTLRKSIGDFFNRRRSSPKSGLVEAAPETDRLPQIPEENVIEIPSLESASEVPSVRVEDSLHVDGIAGNKPIVANLEVPGNQKAPVSPEKEKTKKAHRGRRGGVKHKKGRASSQAPSEDGNLTPKPPPTVEDAVRKAQKLGQQPAIEPDIRTVPSDPQEVSGPVIRIGALEVNTDKLIGTGSNGTLVFEGKFDGRDVAVKRMLIQFFDIASQETKLLRESDDHPNVIRYYAQQSAGEFLYIALELCPASLADVIDKPQKNRDLAQAGEKDLPDVLYQITNGLQHLHKLRIVHRDLKPQNILVAMGKDGKPRLLVSDFGLCKKLEGEQSSFRATTAHAAGTSGWRAPELLLDDDAKDGRAHGAMVDASTDGNSGSLILNPDLVPNRRATRAIDIFSLGLVFFYVLTKGSHPFDCGDKFMREVNIRKGQHNLEHLQVLGDYAYEAKNLINSMLQPNPRERPSARHVMAHPFFWSPKKRLNFLCDVSDHFEKESRDPPTPALQELEAYASVVCRQDFLKHLGKDFVESMGKQRKYTGTKMLDLLRALRNKRNHYEDMSDKLKEHVGPLPDGYLSFWTRRFPNLLISCWTVIYNVEWDLTDRFKEYYEPNSGSRYVAAIASVAGFQPHTTELTLPLRQQSNFSIPPVVHPAQIAQYTVIIDSILRDGDLATISAKKIRNGLQEALDHDLSDQKQAIKELIHERFNHFESLSNLSPPSANGNGTSKSASLKQESTYSSSRAENHPRDPKPEPQSDSGDASPPKKKRKQNKETDDAKLAAMLQAQENRGTRATRGGAGNKVTKKTAKAKKPRKKSEKKVKEEDDSEVEVGSDGEVKEKPKKGGFHKLYHLSLPLADLVGEPTLSRPQVVKKIWEYIKARDLQDPNDKRQILCDEKLQMVFKQDKVHMFTMNKILSKQLYDVEED
ncbi:serine/threonine-protein kinase [Diplocarpon rosae]|nr:serine/threonine-protein kinase [Diplocarpon rosae]